MNTRHRHFAVVRLRDTLFSCSVHVFEAKGGTGQLGHAYGHPQGSAEWAVESARRVLSSAKATPPQKRAAQEILHAASRGELVVDVVRTSHIQGEPTTTMIEQSVGMTKAARKMAAEALKGAGKAGAATGKGVAGSAEGASAAARGASGKILRGAAKTTVVVGVVVDGGLRVNDAMQVERRHARGEIGQHERVVKHAGNGGGFVGGWGGAAAGAKGGAAAGGAIGAVFGGVGAPIGAAIGGVLGGICGYWAGEWAGAAAAESAANAILMPSDARLRPSASLMVSIKNGQWWCPLPSREAGAAGAPGEFSGHGPTPSQRLSGSTCPRRDEPTQRVLDGFPRVRSRRHRSGSRRQA